MTDALRVFVIDDDPAVGRALQRLLNTYGFTVEAFTSPAAFLDRLPYDGLACVLLDLRMPGLSGLDVQQALSRRRAAHPIVFLSARSDVPTTARAMRDGAIDFLVKPVEDDQLLEALRRARGFALSARERALVTRDTEDRLSRLTPREREVCDLVGRGLLNKQIAAELGSSEKTVKVHRGRVMHKLGITSVADLVRLLANRQEGPPAQT
jgi:FixJ family two-component response regulator